MENLAKVIAKEIATNDVLVNAKRGEEIRVDFTLQGSAIVRKGEDFKQVQSMALPYDAIIAVLLSKLNGVTIESVIREALESDIKISEVKAQATAALKRIKSTAYKNTSGKLTLRETTLVVSEIQTCLNCVD
jgi:predicted DNA-binding protein